MSDGAGMSLDLDTVYVEARAATALDGPDVEVLWIAVDRCTGAEVQTTGGWDSKGEVLAMLADKVALSTRSVC